VIIRVQYGKRGTGLAGHGSVRKYISFYLDLQKRHK